LCSFFLGSLPLFEQFKKSTLADKFELYSSFYSKFEAIKNNKKYYELIFEGENIVYFEGERVLIMGVEYILYKKMRYINWLIRNMIL